MSRLVVDPTLQAKLTAPLEFTDESGQSLGYFISPKQFERIRQLEEDRRALYAWANSLITDEELKAAEAEGGEDTHEEVMEYLRRLEATERVKSA
jgi:hypothetical protein